MITKRILGTIVSKMDDNSCFKRLLIKINGRIFHSEAKEKRMSFGNLNPDVTFYVIRSFSDREGLLSQWSNACDMIIGALEDRYEPIVDYKNYKTMYWDGNMHAGADNAWEYYFTQPTSYALDEVYKSQNVILGDCLHNKYIFNEKKTRKTTAFVKQYADAQPYIYKIVEEKMKNLLCQGEILGVLVRGTDYVKIKPKNHAKQPEIWQIEEKVDSFLEKYNIARILLATEDYNIYQHFKQRYGDLIINNNDYMVKDYAGGWLADEINEKSMYQFGLDYLVKMLCLARCDYLVAGSTAGSRYALLMNDGCYKDYYIFELGGY